MSRTAKEPTYIDERDKLERDTRHQGTATADKVDNKKGEGEGTNKLDDGVYSRCEELSFITVDAEVAENCR